MRVHKIRTDIPVPEPRGKISPSLRSMKKGESILISMKDVRNRTSIYSCAESVGIKVTVRKISDHSFRVWRIS